MSMPSLGYGISSLSYQTEALLICKTSVSMLVIPRGWKLCQNGSDTCELHVCLFVCFLPKEAAV